MDRRNLARAGYDGARRTSPVELPDEIVARVENRLVRSEFDTVDDYVAFVLEEVLARVEEATDDELVRTVDRREVETRLESLGYLD